ncbi:hypothetical protein [Flavobacterium sp. JP2137]|uniref:hypothetical protein n=1 Tax=Flavobacterium sp. JP2137 TaxID=3414510 RepID=UPI003D2FB74C
MNGFHFLLRLRILLCFAFVLLHGATWAQHRSAAAEVAADPIYKTVDKSPEFPGGMTAFQRYLSLNLVLPQEVKEAVGSDFARNIFSLLIEKDGTLSEVVVVQSADPAYDELITAVLLKGPKWMPAQLDQVAVSYRFLLPIAINVNKLKSPR